MNSSGALSGRRGAWRTAFALVALVAAGLAPVAIPAPAQAAGSQVTATRTVYPASGSTLWRGAPITITGTATAPDVGTTATDVYIVLPIPGQTTLSTQTPPQLSAGGHIEQQSDPSGLDAGAIGAHFPSIALGTTATFTATVVVDATSIKFAGAANDITVARATIVQQPHGQWDVGASAGYDLEPVPKFTVSRSVAVGGTPTAPPYLPGTVVDVTYTLSNTAAPGDDATNVVFSDHVENLDLGCTDTPPLTCKVNGIGKTANLADADGLWASATAFGAQLGTIPGGQTRTVTYRATVVVHNPTKIEASAIPHVVSIDSAMLEQYGFEPDTWDDRTPIATVDLALTVVPASTEQAPYGVHLGTPGVTTVSLGNLGPDAATTGSLVRISVEGASFTGATPAGCTSPSPTYYDCPVDPLAGGATWTRSVSVVSMTPVTAFVRARRLGTPPPQYNRNTTGDVSEAWFDIRDLVPPSAWLTSPGGVALDGSVTVAWQGTDAHSSLASYDVRYERAPYNGWFSAPEHPAAWQGTAGTNATIALSPGDTICFRVRARDVAGNLSDWSSARCVTRPLDDRALVAGRGWKRAKGAGFYGGTYTATTRKGATLRTSATQIRQVGVVARTGPTCGRIGVYVGSRLVGRISLRSSRVAKNQVLMLAPFAPASGKITVKALTGGRPIAIDGLVLSH